MSKVRKTKEQLINELAEMRQRIAELEALEAEHKRAEEKLRQGYVKSQETLEATVHALVSVVDMRDPYSAGHQRRVTELACAIAKEMSLPEDQIEGTRMAGLIHDIGKISVPAELLSKPAQLTEVEYGMIRAHAQAGYSILKGTIGFPRPVPQIVLQHHERINGSGYPAGLSGEEILLEARILAVGDVVEAMTSLRPYRGPHSIDKALDEISQNRGVLYDPEVVDACLKLFRQKGFKFERELNFLSDVAKRLTSVLDLEQVLQVTIESAIMAISAAEKGTLHLLDEEAGELVVRASSGFSRELVEAGRFKVGDGYVGWVSEHGKPLIIDNVHAYPGIKPIDLPEVAQEKSAICAPLIARGQTIGTLTLANASTYGAFNERDLEPLCAFANQAAIAIESTHLFQAERRQRREAETLRRTALALTTSLDLNQVIERILAHLQEVVPYDSASVQVLRGDRLVIVGGKGFPSLQEVLGLSFPVYGDNPSREVMRTLEPFILEDAPAAYEAFTQEPLAWIAIRSWLGVPMQISKQPVGMITLSKRQPGFYTKQHAGVAQAFAAQAAIAIENARLFEKQERRVAHLRVISEVGRDIASVLNPYELLQRVVNSLVDVLGYDCANILVMDKEAKEIVLTASAGKTEGLADTKSELAIPIKLEGHVIGVLTVQSNQLTAFDELDHSTVSTLADQLAIAMENARLYRETERLVITDGLTELYNRRHLYEALQREMELVNRYGNHLSLIMLDIDGFKAYNDIYGHLVGDALLRELAQLLAREIRRVDIAARYGGDEFVILLPRINKERAVASAKRIITTVERHQFLGKDGIPTAKVSVSLGVATCPEDGVELEPLIKAADMALLEAKKSDERVCVYEE